MCVRVGELVCIVVRCVGVSDDRFNQNVGISVSLLEKLTECALEAFDQSLVTLVLFFLFLYTLIWYIFSISP